MYILPSSHALQTYRKGEIKRRRSIFLCRKNKLITRRSSVSHKIKTISVSTGAKQLKTKAELFKFKGNIQQGFGLTSTDQFNQYATVQTVQIK